MGPGSSQAPLLALLALRLKVLPLGSPLLEPLLVLLELVLGLMLLILWQPVASPLTSAASSFRGDVGARIVWV